MEKFTKTDAEIRSKRVSLFGDPLSKNVIVIFLLCRFGFIPQTFVLPQDLKLLKQCWENKNGSGDEIFIIKPVSFVFKNSYYFSPF